MYTIYFFILFFLLIKYFSSLLFIEESSINQSLTTNSTAQNESRIRVRNWLMLADQSILEKNLHESAGM